MSCQQCYLPEPGPFQIPPVTYIPEKAVREIVSEAISTYQAAPPTASPTGPTISPPDIGYIVGKLTELRLEIVAKIGSDKEFEFYEQACDKATEITGETYTYAFYEQVIIEERKLYEAFLSSLSSQVQKVSKFKSLIPWAILGVTVLGGKSKE